MPSSSSASASGSGSGSGSGSKSKPAKPPNMSQEAYDAHLARKKKEAAQAADTKAQEKWDKQYAAEMMKRYKGRADPGTVEDWLGPGELGEEWFKEGEWRAAWTGVEFDDDACIKNVTKEGKTKDGYYCPAGAVLPLGAALPEMTVLKYGGYFPAGTSFPGGVMVPMHARMVNVLPEETAAPSKPLPAESLCVVM